jgi:hypothetical protein
LMRRYGGLYHLHPNPDTEAGNPAAFAHCRGGVFLWILDPENQPTRANFFGVNVLMLLH